MKYFLYNILLSILLLLITTKIYAIDITNNNFEAETEGWTKTTSTVVFSTNSTDAKVASRSAEISYTSTTSNGIKQTIFPISADKTYKISGYIKPTTAKKTFIRIAWYQTGSTSQIRTDDSPIVTSGTEWTLTEYTVTPPTAATSAEIRLLVSEGTALFDAISMDEYIAPTQTPSPTIMLPTVIATSNPTYAPTQILTPVPTSTSQPSYDNIYITETFAYPETGMNEWIELYNANSFPVTVNNWYIDDTADSGSLPKQISATIPANGYTVIELSSAMFNNGGDDVRLLDQNKQLKDTFKYTTSLKNKSIGRLVLSSSEVCIQEPTKGVTNSSCIEAFSEDEDMIQPTITVTPTPTIVPTLPVTAKPTQGHIYKKSSIAITPRIHNHLDSLNTYHNDPTTNLVTKHRTKRLATLLASSYSLLSFISIAAKMIIARQS